MGKVASCNFVLLCDCNMSDKALPCLTWIDGSISKCPGQGHNALTPTRPAWSDRARVVGQLLGQAIGK